MAENVPNLHPLFVHFPIALLTLGVLLDVAATALRREHALARVVVSLYLIGSGAAAMAWLSGRIATDLVGTVGFATEELIANHRAFATRTTLIFAITGLGRLALLALRSHVDLASARTLRALLLLTAIFGGWLLVQTAHRGGVLVYEHGVGVTIEARAQFDSEASSRSSLTGPYSDDSDSISGATTPSLIRSNDGSIAWTPNAMDANDIDSLIGLVALSPGSGVVTVEDSIPASGIRIRSTGTVLLLLPDSIGDLQAELRFSMIDFSGTIGLVHHFADSTHFESFKVSTSGKATLELSDGDKVQRLDSANYALPQNEIRLDVLAAGTHLKGFLNGRTVVHGHRRPEIATGKLGILLDGIGELRVFSLRAFSPSPGH